MKKLLGLLFLLGLFLQANAQMGKKDYGTTGGLLGAANFDNFNIVGDNPNDVSYDGKTGWSAGAWVNFPLGNAISLEPQLSYSAYNFSSTYTNSLLPDGRLEYFTLPILFKVHLAKIFAITLGPQFELLTGSDDNTDRREVGDFHDFNFGVTGGLELFPRSMVTFFGRYTAGLTNVDETTPNFTEEYHINNFQVGVKVRLFGGKPKDTDGDGISDKNDKCPDKAGIEKYAGCPIPDTDGDGINDEKDKCPEKAGTAKYAGCPVPDTDGDGILDDVDKCPSVAGTAKYVGCPVPDTDGDGINDENDKCPTVAGTAKYAGCNAPDTDGDGINDETDKCPTQAGTAKYAGCPVPDTDGDGVNDELDRCPKTVGMAAYKGCPDLTIYYKRDEATLTADDKANLDKVVAFLQKNPDINISIEGHTSTVGESAYNQTLSEKRANASMAYIVSKGISASRMTAAGFGEQYPIGDNSTEAGRAKSRRTEIKIAN